MARSDLLLNLVRAGRSRDDDLFARTLEAMVADERSKKHDILADRLEEYLRSNAPKTREPGVLDEKIGRLLFFVHPRLKLDDLYLPDNVTEACRQFTEEHHRQDLLRSYGLEPRTRLLLVGPPGNGKTSLAEALAEALMIPMFVVRYDGVIGSYLGETASRLRYLFEFTESQRCLLFFDEFDTLGKERGDVYETGEIKRVVSSLLMQMDALPPHVVVVTATNHPELLDRAVWRRFQLRLTLPPPTPAQIARWLHSLEVRLQRPLAASHRRVAAQLAGMSFAELREFSDDVLRRVILEGERSNPSLVFEATAARWRARVKPSKRGT